MAEACQAGDRCRAYDPVTKRPVPVSGQSVSAYRVHLRRMREFALAHRRHPGLLIMPADQEYSDPHRPEREDMTARWEADKARTAAGKPPVDLSAWGPPYARVTRIGRWAWSIEICHQGMVWERGSIRWSRRSAERAARRQLAAYCRRLGWEADEMRIGAEDL